MFLTVPFLTGYHGKNIGILDHSHENFPDFWRFTHEGLKLMFKDYSHIEIIPIDGPLEVRLKYLKLDKLLENSTFFRKFIDKIDKPRLGKATSRHLVYAIK